jgi:hypothetical protein
MRHFRISKKAANWIEQLFTSNNTSSDEDCIWARSNGSLEYYKVLERYYNKDTPQRFVTVSISFPAAPNRPQVWRLKTNFDRRPPQRVSFYENEKNFYVEFEEYDTHFVFPKTSINDENLDKIRKNIEFSQHKKELNIEDAFQQISSAFQSK